MTHPALLIDNSVNASSTDKAHWDERYRIGHHPPRDQVNAWIIDHRHYLVGGMALDLACGSGRHTLWLLAQDYEVQAVDFSLIALEQVAAAVPENYAGNVSLLQADLLHWRPQPDSYDLALVTRYWNPQLFPAVLKSVKVGGMCLYRTFHKDILRQRPEFNADYLLDPGELISLIPQHWQILAYEELRWTSDSQSMNTCTSSILVQRLPDSTQGV